MHISYIDWILEKCFDFHNLHFWPYLKASIKLYDVFPPQRLLARGSVYFNLEIENNKSPHF